MKGIAGPIMSVGVLLLIYATSVQLPRAVTWKLLLGAGMIGVATVILSVDTK